MSEPEQGPRVGRYELRGMLGRGGFAEVFRAWDPLLGREVALKALLPHHAVDGEIRARFLDEARKIARLRHPNIVTVHDVGQEAGRPYFTMELVDGPTLEKVVGTGNAVPLERALPLLQALSSAVEHLHGMGIIHRDLKAANVMLDGTGRLVLMDFGIARAIDQTSMTSPGMIIGTPLAMAPEQLRGEPVGAPADIYALGVLAYQMLSGRLPFVGDTARVLHGHAYEAPPPLRDAVPGLPEPVYVTISAALAKHPGERPVSAAAFAAGLTRAVTPPPTPSPLSTPAAPTMVGALPAVDQSGVTRVTLPAPERKRSGPIRLAAGLVGVLVLAAIAGASFVMLGGDDAGAGETTRAGVTALVPGATSSNAPVATAAVGTPAGATTQQPATPTPSGVLAEAAGIVVYSGANHAAAGEFEPGDGVEVCFTLQPGQGDAPIQVLVTKFDRQPRDENDSSVIARSAPLPRVEGERCEGMAFVGGRPGPGQYWVWVMDGSNAVGRGDFRLVRAPATAAPTPLRTAQRERRPASPGLSVPPTASDGRTPSIAITSVRAGTAAVVGEQFVFEVTAINTGAAGTQGGISVSAPGLRVLQAAVVDCDAPSRIDNLRPGQQASAFDARGRPLPARTTLTAPLVELAFVGQWSTGVACRMLVRATAPDAGAMTFLIRVATRDPSGGLVFWPYGSGADIATDQQGLPAIRWNVPVERP